MIDNPKDDAVKEVLGDLKEKWGKAPNKEIIALLNELTGLGCSRRRAAKAIGRSEGTLRYAMRKTPKTVASSKGESQAQTIAGTVTVPSNPQPSTGTSSSLVPAKPQATITPVPLPPAMLVCPALVQTTANLNNDEQIALVWDAFFRFRQIMRIHDGVSITRLLEMAERRVAEIEVIFGREVPGPAAVDADIDTVIHASRPKPTADEFLFEVWVQMLAICAFRLAPDANARATALRELREKYQRHMRDTEVVPLYHRGAA